MSDHEEWSDARSEDDRPRGQWRSARQPRASSQRESGGNGGERDWSDPRDAWNDHRGGSRRRDNRESRWNRHQGDRRGGRSDDRRQDRESWESRDSYGGRDSGNRRSSWNRRGEFQDGHGEHGQKSGFHNRRDREDHRGYRRDWNDRDSNESRESRGSWDRSGEGRNDRRDRRAGRGGQWREDRRSQDKRFSGRRDDRYNDRSGREDRRRTNEDEPRDNNNYGGRDQGDARRRFERDDHWRGDGRRHERRRDNYRRDDRRREDRGGHREDDKKRRDDRRSRGGAKDPFVPETVNAQDLAAESRRKLKVLAPAVSENVARHLVYAGSMMDQNPELAYEHAKAAYRHAARIDIVREALGLTSYLTGRYSEALRELRTYRRMTDDYSHVALEADSERGLGRPEKALAFIAEIPLKRLNTATTLELALVTSGARADAGDSEAGLAVLEKIKVENLDEELRARVELIKADRLEELGRVEEADELRARWNPVYNAEGEVELFTAEDPESDAADASELETDTNVAGETEAEQVAEAEPEAGALAESDTESETEPAYVTAAEPELAHEAEVETQAISEPEPESEEE